MKRLLSAFVVAALLLGTLSGCCVNLARLAMEGGDILRSSGTAVKIMDHDLSKLEFDYYYMDMLSELQEDWYQMYLLRLEGYDSAKPMDEQLYGDSGKTWADYFAEQAVQKACGVLALCDAAKGAGYSLTEQELAEIDNTLENPKHYAKLYGYTTVDAYLQDFYNNKTASVASYEAYLQNLALAQSYHNWWGENLTWTDAEIQAYDAEHDYSNYDYVFLEIDPMNFLPEKSYTDEEWEEALAKAQKIAEQLAASNATNKEELDWAAVVICNDDSKWEEDGVAEDAYAPSSTIMEDMFASSINPAVHSWLRTAGRKPGDIGYAPYYRMDDEGNPTEEIVSYYVVIFLKENRNEDNMVSVRHILKLYEGGTTDEETGEVIYSDWEKQAAEDQILQIKAEWEQGEATEEAFGELSRIYTEDGSGTEGGLYRNVYPGYTVYEFDAWCFDKGREPGDVGVVHTPYGCHLIYFVETQEETHRRYMIETDLRNEAMETWFTELRDFYVESAEILNVSGLFVDALTDAESEVEQEAGTADGVIIVPLQPVQP